MRISFKRGGATASVNLVSMNLGFLNSLYSNNPKHGQASEVMLDIITWADASAITLLLTVQANGHSEYHIRDNIELITFYSKFGFERQLGAPVWPARMRREPSQELQAP